MFEGLKENLKIVMKEELEIIVNEEQFLGDEEPMLEDVTVRCQDLNVIMESLKKLVGRFHACRFATFIAFNIRHVYTSVRFFRR